MRYLQFSLFWVHVDHIWMFLPVPVCRPIVIMLLNDDEGDYCEMQLTSNIIAFAKYGHIYT